MTLSKEIMALSKLPWFPQVMIELGYEPVKHGSWELVDVAEPRRYGCSKCKRLVFQPENYCPSCGAKMDEVTE